MMDELENGESVTVVRMEGAGVRLRLRLWNWKGKTKRGKKI